MSFIQVVDEGSIFVVNTDDGEIVSTITTKKSKPPLPHIFTNKFKEIGKDIKFPSECLDAESYYNAVRQLDGMVGNKVKVNDHMIVQYVSQGLWSKVDTNIIQCLATKVVAHNRAFTTLKELSEVTGVRSNHISRWFSDNKSTCKVVSNRNGFVVDIYPDLVFKGSNEWKEAKIQSWTNSL